MSDDHRNNRKDKRGSTSSTKSPKAHKPIDPRPENRSGTQQAGADDQPGSPRHGKEDDKWCIITASTPEEPLFYDEPEELESPMPPTHQGSTRRGSSTQGSRQSTIPRNYHIVADPQLRDTTGAGAWVPDDFKPPQKAFTMSASYHSTISEQEAGNDARRRPNGDGG